MRRSVCLLLLLFFVCASGLLGAPQEGTGAIAGAVYDPKSAVIPGATVTITNDTGFSKTLTTDEKGEFLVTGLTPGNYTVKISFAGFEDSVNANQAVTPGETTRVDVFLSPKTQATEVKVESQVQGAEIETESSKLGNALTSKEVTQIGLNGRNFSQFATFAPGVSNQTGQDEPLVGPKGNVKYSVNGGRVEYNSYDVDGGDILNTSINGNSSTLIVTPSIDAIDSLQVLTSNYGAEYGRSASGTILVTTKSGGQQFHGNGYIFIRNEALNARNFFDQTKSAPLYRKYDPGFTIGGPIYIPGVYNTKKDKTFFFWSEEWRHDQEPVEYNQGVPSAAERNCLQAAQVSIFCKQLNSQPDSMKPWGAGTVWGDFSDVCPGVDPFTGSGSSYSRNPNSTVAPYFPDCPTLTGPSGTGNNINYSAPFGNLVPIDPRSLAILQSNIIPQANSNFGCSSSVNSCYVAAVSPLTNWREDLFRIDHNFSATQKVYFRYIHDSWDTVVTAPVWATIHNSYPTVENNWKGPGTSMVAHYVIQGAFGGKLINDLAMTYVTDHMDITNRPGPGVTSLARPAILDNAPCISLPGTGPNPPQGADCGIGYIFNNGGGGKIPGLVVAGTNTAYGTGGFSVDSAYMPWTHSNPTYAPREDLTYQLTPKHRLQAGLLFTLAQRNEINPPVGANTGDLQGIATFTNVNNFQTTGNAFADFLTAAPQNYTQDSAQGKYHTSYKIYEPYIQDVWNASKRLTVTAGLRFSIFGLYEMKNNYAYNWVPSQFNSLFANEVTVDPRRGYLIFNDGSGAVPLSVSNLDPHLLNGTVRCGVSTYSNGTKVPRGCMENNPLNLAPRVGIAFDPTGKGKTSIRAGYGIFWEHGIGNEANVGSLEGSPANIQAGGVINMTQYYPFGWGCIGYAGPDCPFSSPSGVAFPINATNIPTKVTWPYVQQWNLSVQQSLPYKLLGTLAYVGSKGTHLTAELQANQLSPVNAAENPFLAGQPISCGGIINGHQVTQSDPYYYNYLAACAGINPQSPVPNSLRQAGGAIAPSFGQVYSLQNIANSSYNALQFNLRRTQGDLTLGLSYTYSHSIDNSSDRVSSVFINAYDISSNRASSDFDQRHLVSFNYIYKLPLMKLVDNLRDFGSESASASADAATPTATSPTASSLQKALFDGWELSGVTIYQTGTPFSIINGGSANGVSVLDNAGVVGTTGYSSYADVVPGSGHPVGIDMSSVFGPLLGNPSEFVAPRGLTFGDSGRNYMRNPDRINFDISLAKFWKIKEQYSLEFRLETYNTFNHTQFRIYDPSNTGNTGNNVITCYGSTTYSAGDPSCVSSSSFLHPINAHRPRTMQLGLKFQF